MRRVDRLRLWLRWPVSVHPDGFSLLSFPAVSFSSWSSPPLPSERSGRGTNCFARSMRYRAVLLFASPSPIRTNFWRSSSPVYAPLSRFPLGVHFFFLRSAGISFPLLLLCLCGGGVSPGDRLFVPPGARRSCPARFGRGGIGFSFSLASRNLAELLVRGLVCSTSFLFLFISFLSTGIHFPTSDFLFSLHPFFSRERIHATLRFSSMNGFRFFSFVHVLIRRGVFSDD